jgi:hypothetical protein
MPPILPMMSGLATSAVMVALMVAVMVAVIRPCVVGSKEGSLRVRALCQPPNKRL